jgi:hypothetical protein
VNTIIAFALLALTALLFYRWVERRHKLFLGKLALGVMGLLALAAAYLWWTARRSDAEYMALQRSVSVAFVADSGMPRLSSDTVSQVSFRLCNSGSDTVTSVEFWPKTLRNGRSTESDLVVQNAYAGYRSNEFTSDYILAPQRCITLSWEGEFVVLDTVIPGPVSVTRSRVR